MNGRFIKPSGGTEHPEAVAARRRPTPISTAPTSGRVITAREEERRRLRREMHDGIGPVLAAVPGIDHFARLCPLEVAARPNTISGSTNNSIGNVQVPDVWFRT